MVTAGQIAFYVGFEAAMKFLSTKDNMERALMQGILENAHEYRQQLDEALANRIANEVAKRFSGK